MCGDLLLDARNLLSPAIAYPPEQPGDVPQTWADISKAQRLLGYRPTTDFAEGLKRFASWLSSSSG